VTGSVRRRGCASSVLAHALVAVWFVFGEASAGQAADTPAPQHGIAMVGTLKYPADFAQFDYVDPAAPKGGKLILAVNGSFDSTNPLIIKGDAVSGATGFVFESLLARALDEPFSLYGLLAQSIETPLDRSSVTFRLRPEAKFSDGKPVTIDDVIFSLELLREKGRPNHRDYYSKVARIDRVGTDGVTFAFKDATNRELPLILGLMPILPKHAIDVARFETPSVLPMIGSGPYVMHKIDPGRTMIYRRNPEYWGRDLALNRGRFNFERVEFQYFRDQAVLFEAFKSGAVDLQSESDPSRWVEAYNFPAITSGAVVKREFDVGLPAGMNGLFINTRRPAFADQRVRKALITLFDFEWLNRNLYAGQYKRTRSFFARSELASSDKPADAREQALLAPFASEVDPVVMAKGWQAPTSDGTGFNRANLRKALSLLKEAGYVNEGKALVDAKTKVPLSFEILIGKRDQERMLGSYVAALAQIGITARLKQIDPAQLQERQTRFDFDMMPFALNATLSPGNEQLFRWSSTQADTQGSFNLTGVKSPAADAAIAGLLNAATRDDQVSAIRALDRVLLSKDLVLPLFYLDKQWVAHASWLRQPAKTSLYGYQLDTWWADPATAPKRAE
jgi:peptide/nickel transport system substrate-binding protein